MPNGNNEREAIRQQMHDRIDGIAKELFPNCPIELKAHDIRIGNKGSLQIYRHPKGNKIYECHEIGDGGDIYNLVKYALGCDFKTAYEWCKSRTSASYIPPTTSTVAKQAKSHCPKKRAFGAKKLWDSCSPIANTLAETYLRNRHITVELPDTLRFHPGLPYFRSYDSDTKRYTRHYPALVCKVQDGEGNVSAIHVVYLDNAGNKITAENPAKLSKGSIKGNAVRFGTPCHHVFVCEGVEDALSMYQMYKDSFVMAGLGTGNLRHIQLPECVKHVSIARDNDDAGIGAAEAWKEQLDSQDYRVNILRPPQGKDFNDYIKRRATLLDDN